MLGLDDTLWSCRPALWVDILHDWSENLRQKGLPSTTTLRYLGVCLPLTMISDEDVQTFPQLVDLLLQRVPTRCPVERIQWFEFDFFIHEGSGPGGRRGRSVTSDRANRDKLDSIIQHCCRFCQNLPLNITNFSLTSKSLHSHAIDLILSALSQNRHLTELAMDAFPPILTDQLIPCNPLLKSLTLEEKGATSEQASARMRHVFSGKTLRLRTFIYSNDHHRVLDRHPGASELDVETMMLLKSNTHLENLTFKGYRFGDAGAVLIAEVLTVNKSLRHLQMNDCDIGDRGCMALCEALQVNHKLECLDLVDNKFGDACEHSFVSALRINRALRALGIDKCVIAAKLLGNDTHLQRIYGFSCDEPGLSLIAKGLEVNESIKSLEFRYGSFWRESAIIEALASALKINNTLQHLSLRCGCHGNEAATFFAEALTVNKSLKRLEMFGGGIREQGCKALAQALQVNNTLEKLALNSYMLRDLGVRAFIPTLRINRTLQHLEIRCNELPAKETAEELLQVVRHFLLPVRVSFPEAKDDILFDGPYELPTVPLLMRLTCASLFNCDFDKKCRELRDGTISDGHASFQWFLPFLGSTHPFVKKIVLFLLLRQRAEVAAKSLLQEATPRCCTRKRNRVETTVGSN